MIELPDVSESFLWENNFYLSCDPSRIGRMIAHYELYKMALEVPGAVAECGVFKGTALVRFAAFRELLGSPIAKKIIGFDVFGRFPETQFEADKQKLEEFVQAAGDESIGEDQMMKVLERMECRRQVELVAGDICETVPAYCEAHPEMRFSIINLDTDIYEPACVILEYLYPRLQSGGILILDDYGKFPGETKAVDDYFEGRSVAIKQFPFAMSPCYLVKP